MSASDAVDIFLCHTGANKDWTRDLATKLEADEVDGRPLKVFFDEWDIDTGENILSRIEEGLRSARFIAVVLSPALTRASWPTLEWQTQVYEDPSGKRARIIPLVVQKHDPETLEPLDIPLPLRLLRYIDFSDPKKFGEGFEQLLAKLRGQRPSRGRATVAESVSAVSLVTGPEVADPVEEVLLSNLFPVTSVPEQLYSHSTNAVRYTDVWKKMTGRLQVPFVLYRERIHSFIPNDAQANPFRQFFVGTDSHSERTEDLLKDEDRARQLVWLCNHALREHCYSLKIRTSPRDRNQYYPPSFDGQPRSFTWGAGRPIQLAKVAESDGNRLGVHHSARMRFIIVAHRLHLLIEPGWFFTVDGVEPVEGRQVGVLSVKWGGREGNATVLRHTLMWARLLAAGQPAIVLPVGGNNVMRVAPVPTFGRANVGIFQDSSALERLLAGEGAGELLGVDAGEDLDRIAEAHLRGAIELEDDSEEDGEDPDAISEIENVIEQTEAEPEFPW